MPDGYAINPGTLEQVVGSLRRAGDELANTSASPSFDAGDQTAVFQKVISKLIKDADQLSTGLLAASSEVDKARQDYLNEERRGQQSYRP